MGRLLDLLWVCRVFLTVSGAYRYCTENLYSPVCSVSAFYAGALIVTLCISAKPRDTLQIITGDEDRRLRTLEEGLTTFTKQNGSASWIWQTKVD